MIFFIEQPLFPLPVRQFLVRAVFTLAQIRIDSWAHQVNSTLANQV